MVHEIQKLITSIVLVIVVVFGIAKISDILFTTEKNVVAYKVEVQEKQAATATEQEIDLPAFLALGTVEHGKKVFKKCAACHMIVADGKNKIGPNLWGVIGRKAGSIGDYNYSKAMVAYAKEWNFEEMNSYLIKPQAYIKGTKMAFAGLRKEKDRASVILYMNSKSSSPKAIP